MIPFYDEVRITDNLLTPDDVKLLYGYFINAPFTLKHRSDALKQSIHKAQLAHFLTNEELDHPVVQKIIESCTNLKHIIRIYVQVYTESTEPIMHRDNSFKTSITFLHPEYDVNWGGEFIIYGEETVGMAIQPLSGRNVNFPGGRLLHLGRPFLSKSKTNRFILTVAYND